jgi:uncharacterized protein YdeI (YjbR/CyaY-like superfamily)
MKSEAIPVLTFSTAADFARWLASEPGDSRGAWLIFAKKGASLATIDKSDAIDVALAHGWIDGQIGGVDDACYKTRFTPRRPGGVWSKLNRDRAERLIASGHMTPAGLAQVERAKADGRWAAAYAGQRDSAAPDDLMAALDENAEAKKLFDALDSANRYSILYRIGQAKTAEKRAAKIAQLVAMLSRGETIHPRRAKRRTRG